MTVQTLLASASSREISEWMVMMNLDHWKELLAKKAREAKAPDPAVVMGTLFGSKVTK